MTAAHIALLLVAGLAAGAVNAIAGGGSLITFPALLATGLAAKAANVTNSVAVAPGYFAAVYGSRPDLGELVEARGRRTLLWLIPTCIIGTAAGCGLLLATPASAFQAIVPFLVIGAGFALAFQENLRRVVGHPREMSPARRTLSLHAMVAVGSVYGGYFGAALGVMLVAALGLVLDESLNRINALKNAISATVGVITLAVFAVFGAVDWVDVLLLAPATVVGGYAGAHVARQMHPAVLRAVIVALAFAVGIVLLIKAFA